MNDSFFEQKWLNGVNGKICYFVNQKFPSRPTIIFLHGLSANHTTWNAAARALNNLQINILMPDLRGHGHSDKSKNHALYKIPVFTKDLKEIIVREKLTKIILAGYSFGGSIAIDFAAKYPDLAAGLILISASHISPLRYKHLSFLIWPVYGFLNLLAWLLLWQKRKQYFYFNQETVTGHLDSTFKGFTTMPLSINFWMLSEIIRLNLSRAIAHITCPTLIIKSKHDPFFSSAEARDMVRSIKNSEMSTLQESTHFLASRHQEKITQEIIDFLKEKDLL